MFKGLNKELKNVLDNDPAARSKAEVYLLYSGFKAVRAYRKANWFYNRGMKFIARCISQRARKITGIEIHPGATIGENLFIDHGMGVVIGETTEIGDNCIIYQGVTLGGTGKDFGKRHPTLGDNVLVGAGAKILGPFRVGNNARIAAGAVVLREVPDNATAVGVPARIVKIGDKKMPIEVPVHEHEHIHKKAPEHSHVMSLDHIHITDPVLEDINAMKLRIEQLEKELKSNKERTQ